MELIVVRHGRPVRVEGSTTAADPELTEVGRRQADATSDWLAVEPIDAVYSSPMVRARQTAEPLARVTGHEIGFVEGVREYDAEDPHYIPMEEMKTDKAAWKEMLDDHLTRDWAPFRRTVREAMEEIIANHRGETVAVFCHGGVINAWAAELLDLPMAQTMFMAPEYASINRFRAASSGERSILTLNEAGHLRADDLILTR